MAVGLYVATRATEMPFATLLVMALVFYRVTGQLAQTQHAFQQLAHAEAFYTSVQARLAAAAAVCAEQLAVALPEEAVVCRVVLDAPRRRPTRRERTRDRLSVPARTDAVVPAGGPETT